jgi:hypothetical protein
VCRGRQNQRSYWNMQRERFRSRQRVERGYAETLLISLGRNARYSIGSGNPVYVPIGAEAQSDEFEVCCTSLLLRFLCVGLERLLPYPIDVDFRPFRCFSCLYFLTLSTSCSVQMRAWIVPLMNLRGSLIFPVLIQRMSVIRPIPTILATCIVE